MKIHMRQVADGYIIEIDTAAVRRLLVMAGESLAPRIQGFIKERSKDNKYQQVSFEVRSRGDNNNS